MQNVPEVGKLIEGEARRDAIHVAVAPVTASCRLAPGEPVWVENGIAYDAETPQGEFNAPTGIVDPFLAVPWVEKGQRFYVFLFPGTVTSLRHVWSHPAFQARPFQEREDTPRSPSEIGP